MTEPERPSPRSPDELAFETILYEKTPPRATITLNRPEVLNAFDFRMLRELARACEDASWDDDVRVVVLTGAGRAFCVGANLRSWAEEGYVGDEREYWKWFGAMDAGVTALRRIAADYPRWLNSERLHCEIALQPPTILRVVLTTLTMPKRCFWIGKEPRWLKYRI